MFYPTGGSCSRCGRPVLPGTGYLCVPPTDLGTHTHQLCFDLALEQIELDCYEELEGKAWDILSLLGHLAREDSTLGREAKRILA